MKHQNRQSASRFDVSNFNIRRYIGMVGIGLILVLSGCKSTTTNTRSVGPNSVGPGVYSPLGSNVKQYSYHSQIYLDVAVPVYDPGLPMDEYGNVDDQTVLEEDIWPQVRRAEAKRFAIATKEALAKTKSFGAINVTPTTNTSADLFVLGRINYSDTETINLGVKVIDGSNRLWGQKEFEHRVSPAFYRDAKRASSDPYGPVFKQVADYVYSLVKKKKESELENIKLVSNLRYAAAYSPDSFNQYLDTSTRILRGEKYTVFEATGAPSLDDPMLKRIEAIRAQDQMFVDNLQENYDLFHLETDSSYRKYQRDTMVVARKIREEKNDRMLNQGLAVGSAILAGLLLKNSKSDAGKTGAAIAGATAIYSLSSAVSNNRELGKQRELLNEMGQSLDIEISPQVMEFEDQEIELTGTAGEQYEQWKAHLYRIYELEETPDVQL